jgi:Zn-dependent M28 family amino/carboxypeptidase
LIVDAFGEAGLAVVEEPVPASNGVNLIATLGQGARAILVGAHYDHLGAIGGSIYWGADDNAAAVAILVEVGRALAAGPPLPRRVILCAFDAEEPPHFLGDGMGSEHFAARAPVDEIDLMIAMDLVGHALGPPAAPPRVRDSLFALGAETSEGTAALVDSQSSAGLVVRRAGINVLPPLSDYHPFQRRGVPFLFLTGGRWRHYHTPEDTPEKLSYEKIAATAAWLTALVRAAALAPGPRKFLPDGRDDASTVRALVELSAELDDRIHARAVKLLANLRERLTPSQFMETQLLLATVESLLA